MKMFEVIIVTLSLISASPSMSGEYGEAADNLRRAMLETEQGKTITKNADRMIDPTLAHLGLKREDFVYASVLAPIATGKISTKGFSSIRVGGSSWDVRPEIEYSIKDDHRFDGLLVFHHDL